MASNKFKGGKYKIENLRSRFQTVATDNDYQVFFSLGSAVLDEATALGIDVSFITEDLGLYVSDAVLPGSSFNDVEISGDRQGIIERNAAGRIYDDVTFTFYVDRNYDTLRFFEIWLQYINPLYGATSGENTYVTKLNYPDDYKCEMAITKFNKDLDTAAFEVDFNNFVQTAKNQLGYRFFRAWPYSLASTPISYGGINLLRCNVTFRYDRYIVSEVTYPKAPEVGGVVRVPFVGGAAPVGEPQGEKKPIDQPTQTQNKPTGVPVSAGAAGAGGVKYKPQGMSTGEAIASGQLYNDINLTSKY